MKTPQYGGNGPSDQSYPPRSPAPTIIILTLTPNLLDFSLYEQEVVAPEFFLLKPSVV